MIIMYILFALLILIGISIEVKLHKITEQNSEVINQLKHLNTRD